MEEMEVKTYATVEEARIGMLMERMEIIIKVVEESELYRNVADQLRTNQEIRDNIVHVIQQGSSTSDDSCLLDMVIYAIGSLEHSNASQDQLSLAILLKRDFSHWIGGIEVFDPVMTPCDVKVMEALGCKVLRVNEQCRRKVEKPTLFFMPMPYFDLVENLFETNWCPYSLNKMILLTNSLEEISQRAERVDCISAILEHTIQMEIVVECPKYCFCWFHGLAWHFFKFVNPADVDLEAMLPNTTSLETRLEMRAARDKMNEQFWEERRINLSRFEDESCKRQDAWMSS